MKGWINEYIKAEWYKHVYLFFPQKWVAHLCCRNDKGNYPN